MTAALPALPIELWEYIGILTGRYARYVKLALAGMKKLYDPARILRVKKRLTKCSIGPDSIKWYLDNSLHRDDDLPAIINPSRAQLLWLQNGVFHHTTAAKEWYQHGQLQKWE